MGSPLSFVRLLVGAMLPVAAPLLFAHVICALSGEIALLPPARFVLGLPCCLLMGVRGLLCPLSLVRRPAGVVLPFAPPLLLARLLCVLFI